MQPHPVPQNILDIEFKLFGSFTLKQFGKILIGCMLGLFFFILPINILVKFPFVAASILFGVLSAIVPTFETWLMGFMKALFISPRYVWIKEKVNYDLLEKKDTIKPDKQTIQAAKNQKKIDISDIPLDKLFSAQKLTDQGESLSGDVREQNFERVYNEEFKNNLNSPVSSITPNDNLQNIDPQKQMQILQIQLENLDTNDPEYKKKREELMLKIAEIRSKAKVKGRLNISPQTNERIVNAQGQELVNTGQQIFGLIVDKNDTPLQGASIIFTDEATKAQIKSYTDNNGKFATQEKLKPGTYLVQITHPKVKFDTYKIIVSQTKLPAYKFRGR